MKLLIIIIIDLCIESKIFKVFHIADLWRHLSYSAGITKKELITHPTQQFKILIGCRG